MVVAIGIAICTCGDIAIFHTYCLKRTQTTLCRQQIYEKSETICSLFRRSFILFAIVSFRWRNVLRALLIRLFVCSFAFFCSSFQTMTIVASQVSQSYAMILQYPHQDRCKHMRRDVAACLDFAIEMMCSLFSFMMIMMMAGQANSILSQISAKAYGMHTPLQHKLISNSNPQWSRLVSNVQNALFSMNSCFALHCIASQHIISD